MLEGFRDGGWGMFPTLVFGLLMVAAAIRYAARPEARFLPLMWGLGALTVSSGALGFVTGLITTFHYVAAHNEPGNVALQGAGESLNNLAFALMFVVLASLAASFGAWKLAHGGPIAAPQKGQ